MCSWIGLQRRTSALQVHRAAFQRNKPIGVEPSVLLMGVYTGCLAGLGLTVCPASQFAAMDHAARGWNESASGQIECVVPDVVTIHLLHHLSNDGRMLIDVCFSNDNLFLQHLLSFLRRQAWSRAARRVCPGLWHEAVILQLRQQRVSSEVPYGLATESFRAS